MFEEVPGDDTTSTSSLLISVLSVCCGSDLILGGIFSVIGATTASGETVLSAEVVGSTAERPLSGPRRREGKAGNPSRSLFNLETGDN